MSRLLKIATMSDDFLDWAAPIDTHGSNLPHWQQGKRMQFVTFRLGDSLPQRRLDRWDEEKKTWLGFHPKPWTAQVALEYHRRFSAQIERWLDQGKGSCLLREKANREHVKDVLMKFHGQRVAHHAWVIMPNHVHLIFTPMVPLKDLLKAWKGVSARAIGRGPIWQENYRDTLVRDEEHFRNAVRYIRKNPRLAKLPEGHFTLWEDQRAQEVSDRAE